MDHTRPNLRRSMLLKLAASLGDTAFPVDFVEKKKPRRTEEQPADDEE